MRQVTAADLLSLEQYARERPILRGRMIEHRRARQLRIGEHCSMSFEDRDTVRYQVQEMLRTERIFEPDGIADELAAYNPLVPDGRNLKATLLIEYEDPAERASRLRELKGVERRCWMRVQDCESVFAIADEDMSRENDTKTSAVHFLRWEFTAEMVARLQGGAALSAGVDHPKYQHKVDPLTDSLRQTLLGDFDPA